MLDYIISKSGFLIKNTENNSKMVEKELTVTPFIKHTFNNVIEFADPIAA